MIDTDILYFIINILLAIGWLVTTNRVSELQNRISLHEKHLQDLISALKGLGTVEKKVDIQSCPECGSPKTTLGFPYSRCEKCNHVYKGNRL